MYLTWILSANAISGVRMTSANRIRINNNPVWQIILVHPPSIACVPPSETPQKAPSALSQSELKTNMNVVAHADIGQ